MGKVKLNKGHGASNRYSRIRRGHGQQVEYWHITRGADDALTYRAGMAVNRHNNLFRNFSF